MWAKRSDIPQDIREGNAEFVNQVSGNIKTYEAAKSERRAREAVQQEALRKARETRDSELRL